MPISQMGGVINPNQVMYQNNRDQRLPVNAVHHGGMMVVDGNSDGQAEEEYEDQNELIEDEYSDMDREEMYMVDQRRNQDQIVNGHLVQGPVGGGRREGYEGSEHEEEMDYEEGDEEDESEEDIEEDNKDYHQEDFQMEDEEKDYKRKPALTFGMVKK